MFDLGEEIESLAKRVIGAAIEVHKALGPGFLESAYEKAISIELNHRHIEHQCQAHVNVQYKGICVGEGRVDVLIRDKIILELKAVEQFKGIHQSQLISYMRAMDIRLGFLMNFNTAVLKDGIKRFVL